MADAEPLGLATLFRPVCGYPQYRVLVTGDHRGGRSVERGHGDRSAVTEERQQFLPGGLDGHHRAVRRLGLHQPAARRDERARVLQGQDARHVRRGQFADGVAQQELGGQAAVLGPPEEGDLDREQRGLGELRTVQQVRLGRALAGEQHVAQGKPQMRIHGGAHLVERRRVLRRGLVERGRHAGPLASLAGEEEGEGAVGDGAAHGVGPRRTVGEAAQSGRGLVRSGGEQHRAVSEGGPAGGQGVGDVPERSARVGFEVFAQLAGLGAQRLLVPARDEQREGRRGRPDAGPGRCGGAVPFGEHGVAVGAAHAEGAHADDEPAGPLGPGRELGVDPQAQLVQRDGRVGGPVVEAGGDLAVPRGQYALEEPGDARGALEVPDVGLHGADEQRPVGRASRAEHGADGRGLDRVPGRGARTVQLHVCDVARGDPGLLVRGGDHRLLGAALRHREAVAATVVVDRAAGQHAVDVVPVGHRVGEGLQHDEAAALTPYVAVGPGVEGVAAAVRGQRAEAFHGERAVLGKDQVDAAGQGDGALAAPQALGCQVDGDEGRRLPGVHGEARPAQAQCVGNPVGDECAAEPGGRLGGDGLVADGAHQGGVVVGDGSDEDTGPAALQATGHDPRVLQRLPAQFEGEPLLRIHRRGLARGDSEEPRVKGVHGLQEAAPRGGVGALVRSRGHRVPAASQEAQQFVRAGRSRQPARDSHHRDGFGRSCLEFSGL
ncbi:hypothetical protein GCM10010343_72710 [Streptomyces avidinii]|nr:hypothetical protein GCM10010343_72710 [Streptomyces avidinii]